MFCTTRIQIQLKDQNGQRVPLQILVVQVESIPLKATLVKMSPGQGMI